MERGPGLGALAFSASNGGPRGIAQLTRRGTQLDHNPTSDGDSSLDGSGACPGDRGYVRS